MFKKVDKKNSNYGDFIKNHLPSPVGNSIRNLFYKYKRILNVDLFMRRNKLSKYKLMKGWTSGSVKFA